MWEHPVFNLPALSKEPNIDGMVKSCCKQASLSICCVSHYLISISIPFPYFIYSLSFVQLTLWETSLLTLHVTAKLIMANKLFGSEKVTCKACIYKIPQLLIYKCIVILYLIICAQNTDTSSYHKFYNCRCFLNMFYFSLAKLQHNYYLNVLEN